MTTGRLPKGAKENLLGLSKADYKGSPSTLCKGCGHDSVSARIMKVAFEESLPPHQTIKLSGIGCSSKSPAYFLGQSHSFNALHGRMPSVATGAMAANHSLIALGVSGDGDTASIGMGQFKHLMRRNIPMTYIVENNGVYGLTKGQFSATAEEGQTLKYAGENPYGPIDICLEALASNCGFVARSFAGDPRQLEELLRAAIHYPGTAVLDVISPCVTFNNDPSCNKSYPWGKDNEMPLHEISYIPHYSEITVDDYEPGTTTQVQLHDGSLIRLKKLEYSYDPTDKREAASLLEKAIQENLLLTGLIYIDDSSPTFHKSANMSETPLVEMKDETIRPAKETLDALNKSFR